MGTGSRSGVVHLFDLEHAKMYIDPATGEHIPNNGRRHTAGTMRYASLAAHQSHDDVLSRTPTEFAAFRAHCASLQYGAAPDYALLRGLFRERMRREGWRALQPQGGNGFSLVDHDGSRLDWVDPAALPGGTLLPEEYFVHMHFVEEPYWDSGTM
ncbi:hypothetical protein C8Q73DRAFT_794543 [Cubamyces lactineus]|nr:hypothetical protein C8Q73DRAFT_794543 [Cubamyces lactineus]